MFGAGCAGTPATRGSIARIPQTPRARAHALPRHAAPSLARTHDDAASDPTSDPIPPSVFIHVGPTADRTGRLRDPEIARLTAVVEGSVADTGYATTWPGPLPTEHELRALRARAFALSSTVMDVAVERLGAHTRVACEVDVHVAPWNGTDGEERWESGKTAHVRGAGQAMTDGSPAELAGGLEDCAAAVVAELTTRHVMPFVRRSLVDKNVHPDRGMMILVGVGRSRSSVLRRIRGYEAILGSGIDD